MTGPTKEKHNWNLSYSGDLGRRKSEQRHNKTAPQVDKMVAASHAVSAFFHHSLLSFLLLNLLSTLPLDINCGGWSSGAIGGGAGSRSLFLLASASFSPKDYLKREHSLVKPYHGSAWDYGGSTMVTSNYVRLTSDKPSQAGIVWNRVPCHLRFTFLWMMFELNA